MLVSIGRKPNTGGLGLDKVGLATNKLGQIETDHDFRTSVPGIWAGGDCVAGGQDLTVAAVEDGKQAALSIDRALKSATATRAA